MTNIISIDNNNNNNNNNNNQGYGRDINFASNAHAFFSNIILPPYCTLLPRTRDHLYDVVINFVHPRSNHSGFILFYKEIDEDDDDNVFEVVCDLYSRNEPFMALSLTNLNETLPVIAFSQQLLQYQPNNLDNIDYVLVPQHLFHIWDERSNYNHFRMINNEGDIIDDDPVIS